VLVIGHDGGDDDDDDEDDEDDNESSVLVIGHDLAVMMMIMMSSCACNVKKMKLMANSTFERKKIGKHTRRVVCGA
jgi:hypothetical protein